MPELPEVETVRRGLTPLVVGRRINEVKILEPRLRYPVNADLLISTLSQQEITAIHRRGKYLLLACQNGWNLMAHLGMTGRFQFCNPNHPQEKHAHAVFSLNGKKELRFVNPRRFGVLEAVRASELNTHRLLQDLGPEPLLENFNGDYLKAKCRNRKRPIKNFIMDSKIVVGVGNIYASEALFHCGIHPHRPAGRISAPRLEKLVQSIKTILARAIEVGGTTLKDFRDPQEEAGYFAIELTVYDREGKPCPSCSKTIRRSIQSNRSTFYCPQCQR